MTARSRRVSLLLLGFVVFACREPDPVARLTAQPRYILLAGQSCATIDLTWEILGRLEKQHGQPKVFVHLYSEREGMVRAFDHPFTAPWMPGARVQETVLLCDNSSQPPVTDGPYHVRIGLYDSEWGYRWRVSADGPELAPRAYGVVRADVRGWRPLPAAPTH